MTANNELAEYLLAGLALAAGQAGKVPGTGQILSFRHPPALGGHLDISNVEVSDFVVAVDIAGQIRDRIRSLPPGASRCSSGLRHAAAPAPGQVPARRLFGLPDCRPPRPSGACDPGCRGALPVQGRSYSVLI